MKFFRQLIIVALIMIGLVQLAGAGFLGVDSRQGVFFGGSGITTRNTRITYGELFPKFSGRFVNSVYNGWGLTGAANNYRLGLQGVYDLSPEDSTFTIIPFAGFGVGGSDLVASSVSMDLGFDAGIYWLDWLSPKIGMEAVIFSDSTTLDYYFGGTITIDGVKDWLDFDVLFTGLLSLSSTAVNKLGIAVRLNFKVNS